MKSNVTLPAVVLMLVASICPAQNDAPFKWEAGTGIGLLPTYAKDRSTVVVPPLNAYLAYRVSGIFSVEAFGGYSASQALRTSSISGEPYLYTNRYRFIGMRFAAHTDPFRFERWDIYGGMSGMYTLARIERTPTSKSAVDDSISRQPEEKGKFCATAFIGARYALNKYWGVWGELGYGASLGSVGVAYRFADKARK